MKLKKLIGMAVVLALLVGIALWQRRGEDMKRVAPVSVETTLLSDVDMNAVTQLDVTQGSNQVMLAKNEGRWVVESLYNYPVDFSRLADALRKMAEVKTGSPVRAGNVAASEFGLDENSKQIELKTASEKTAGTVTVGARREASDAAGWANQFFIRQNGSDAVYLVDYDFRPFSEKPADWISKELLRVPSADIVSVKRGDVELRQDGAEWTLADINSETEEFQSSEANRLRSALQYLSCVTIADPAKTDAELSFDKPSVYIARTKDGFTYTVNLGAKTEEGHYARIAVDYTRAAPPVEPEGDDAEKKEAYSKELDAYNNRVAANEAKVDKLNALLSNWTYIISSYAADNLLVSRSELVKPKETNPTPTPAETL